MTDATFQRLLQSVLFDNRYDRYVSNRRTGKLDTKKLRKISYSDKFFKKKEERKNKNYSIALLVDCSGSMRGPKADLAFASAQKLSKHLSSAKINHAIYGFHTPTQIIKGWSQEAGRFVEKHLHDFISSGASYYAVPEKDRSMYEDTPWGYRGTYEFAGYTRQYYPKFKKLEADKSKMVVTTKGAGYNNDPDAIRYVAKELHKQPGTKVMIVLSDGMPAGLDSDYQSAEFPKETYTSTANRKLKKVVNDVIKSGIELHSIGILDDSVNEYYPASRTCAIYDLGQLYDHIIKIVKLNMKRS